MSSQVSRGPKRGQRDETDTGREHQGMAAEAVSPASMSHRSTRRTSAMTTLQVRAEDIHEGEFDRDAVRDGDAVGEEKLPARERSP
jgi:hypothetical protein